MGRGRCFFACALALAFFAGRSDAAPFSITKVRPRPAPPSLYLLAAPSILVGDWVTAPGVNFQISGRPVRDLPLYLTGDIGLFFPSSYYYATTVAVPILFGADYQFQIANTRLRPLVGVNFGPVIARRFSFAMLFRIGLNIGLGHGIDVNIEPRFGVVASTFVFVPQFGLRFAI